MELKTPAEWREYLEHELDLRRPFTERYEDFYDGRHPLAFTTNKFKEAFGEMFEAFADNYMQLVVDVPVDRLKIDGFDFGDDAVNERAWKAWRELGMTSRSLMGHTEAVKNGTSYVLVDPDGGVTVEHPLQCYVELDPADPQHRLAGIKKWQGLDGYAYANVYLPDGVHKFRQEMEKTTTAQTGQRPVPVPRGGWEPKLGDEFVANPFEVVSLIPLANNPSIMTGGRSDLDVPIPLQNAVNKECADLIVASEYQAYKQRVLTGVEVPKYPEGHAREGEPIDGTELRAAISRTWFIENPDAKAFDLGETDLKNYVQVIEMFVQHIATKTRIPPQYLLASGSTLANVSAEAMAVIESGFVSKVERKQDDFGPAWAEVMRLALKAKGTDVKPGTVVWRPASPPAVAQLADAMAKYATVGVPFEWIWRQIGATPEEVVEWRKLLDARNRAAAAGAPGPADELPALPEKLKPASVHAAIDTSAPPTVTPTTTQ